MTKDGRRQALLIGSPLGGLEGVANDILSIGTRLEARGFVCKRCVGKDATRATILDELEVLKQSAERGDAIVVYYSGHGGRCHLVAERGGTPEPAGNYLVPMDHDREKCFRGVADFELALIFHALALKTRNVTVILDSCHSSTMVRDDERGELFRGEPEFKPKPEERVRNWDGRPEYLMPEDMKPRYEEFRRRRGELHQDSNPHVVRLVATAAGSPAFEFKHGTACGGYFTAALCEALDDCLHAPLAWDTLIRSVRERIVAQRGSTTQRAELEGPRSRLPFSMTTAVDIIDRSTLVYGSDGRCWVRSGRLHGLEVGDEVDVLGSANASVAKAVVKRLFDDSAEVIMRTEAKLVSENEERFPPNGSAVAVERFGRQRSVWVHPSVVEHVALCRGIEGQARLRVENDPQRAEFRVVVKGGGLALEGPKWLYRLPRPMNAEGIAVVVHDLDDLARRVIFEEELSRSTKLEGVEWAAEVFVEPSDGEPRLLMTESKLLAAGTRLQVELRHATRGGPTLYVSVLDRGVAGKMSLLNPSQPAGVQLRAPEGEAPEGRVQATVVRVPSVHQCMVLGWPEDVPTRRGLTEEIVCVASLRPIDLRSMLSVEPELRRKVDGDGTGGASKELSISGNQVSDTDPAAGLGTELLWEVRRTGFGVRA